MKIMYRIEKDTSIVNSLKINQIQNIFGFKCNLSTKSQKIVWKFEFSHTFGWFIIIIIINIVVIIIIKLVL